VGRLTHVDEHGKAAMVDVTGKPVTFRVAEARCVVRTSADTAAVLADPTVGADLIESARFSGILAAKRTSSLIPLCHPIPVEGMTVDIEVAPDGFSVRAVASVSERTGVEMEALTACAVAGLVLLQPLLRPDPRASVEDLTLWHKSGGRSGTWQRPHGGPAGTDLGESNFGIR